MKIWRAGCLILLAMLFSCVSGAQSVATQSETQIQKGPLTLIPGCGNSGCNAYYNICVDVPKGATPIAITNYFDSFVGWGGFGNPQKTATGFCATYWQHSHNMARNVSFDVIYQPANRGQIPPPPVTNTLETAPTEEDIQRKALTGEPFSGPHGSPSRTVSGQYLQKLIDKLRDNPDAKLRGLQINGAEFSGDIVISNPTIPFPLHLKNCVFHHRFVVRDARFERSLVVEGATVENGFEFESTNLKEDLILDADIPVGNVKSQITDLMRDVHVDGRTEIATGDDISVSFLKTGDLHIVTIGDNHTMSLDALDANTVRIDSAVQGSKIKSLAVTGGHIHTSMRVSAANLDTFSGQRSEIERLVLVGTVITGSLDLSFANIDSLAWAMGNVGSFPESGKDAKVGNDLTGLTFRNIEITRNSDPSKIDQQSMPQNQPTGAQLTKVSQNPETEKSEIASTSLELLDKSKYSASAYDSLEKLLRGRGDSKADDVFVDGREAKRLSGITWKRPLSLISFIVDLFQEYVLGYGRMAWYPMFWSGLTILVGYFAFTCNAKVQKMELVDKEKDAGSIYSPFWYSFELFVPVIDVGVAKKWHPKPEYGLLTNYARLHEIAGWILVPVILATITGLTK